MSSPKRKPARSEGVSDELQRHDELMREAGSSNGAWNPEPDQHIAGILHESIALTPNEVKAITYVKACCLRFNVKLHGERGRCVWGVTENGKKLTRARMADKFEWDLGNTNRYLKRPLAWGFIRENADGILGIGARISTGALVDPDGGENEANDGKEVVCTDNLPKYLFEESKRLSSDDRERFFTMWGAEKKAAQERLAAAVAQEREAEQKRLIEVCNSFGLTLKTGKKKRAQDVEPEGVVSSVQTTQGDLSVQSEKRGPYTADSESVQTRIYKEAEKTQKQRTSSSAPVGILEALRAHGPVDDDDVANQLFAACRSKAREATEDDVVRVIHQRAKQFGRTVRNPVGLLLDIVPKIFASDRWHAAPVTNGHPPLPAQHLSERARADALATLKDMNASRAEREAAEITLGIEKARGASA